METAEIKVFVTYCWEDEAHTKKVLSFTDKLRKMGYAAMVDQFLMQEESAIDFNRMMIEEITKNHKVIVVLSPKYKKKADEFDGGVGKEYQLLTKLFSEQPNKIILVSFTSNYTEVTPLAFKDRFTIDLSQEKGFEDLEYRLQEIKKFKVSSVSPRRQLTTEAIQDFNVDTTLQPFESDKLHLRTNGASHSGTQYYQVSTFVAFSFTNVSNRTIEGYSISVKIDRQFLSTKLRGTYREGDFVVRSPDKIFPLDVVYSKEFELQIERANVYKAVNASIKVEINSDLGISTFEFPVLNCLISKSMRGNPTLTPDDFQ